jgi:hypothetical protein
MDNVLACHGSPPVYMRSVVFCCSISLGSKAINCT